MESLYRRHDFPPEIISHAIWLYHRFTLSFRDVEDLLAERGITASYQAIRPWRRKFWTGACPYFAATTRPTRQHLARGRSVHHNPRRTSSSRLHQLPDDSPILAWVQPGAAGFKQYSPETTSSIATLPVWCGISRGARAVRARSATGLEPDRGRLDRRHDHRSSYGAAVRHDQQSDRRRVRPHHSVRFALRILSDLYDQFNIQPGAASAAPLLLQQPVR